MSRYLITFDMDTNCLAEKYHHNNPNNAYADIRRVLEKHGFKNIQGSVYLGDESISEAHGTIAIQEVTYKFDWFNPCVSNIRFYRLESDLNVQFISDRVFEAKQSANARLALLRESLVESGLSNSQIDNILSKQKQQDLSEILIEDLDWK